jgi:hypothetical protein
MGTANQLIEEFMLLANRRVAEFIEKNCGGMFSFTGCMISLIRKSSVISGTS